VYLANTISKAKKVGTKNICTVQDEINATQKSNPNISLQTILLFNSQPFQNTSAFDASTIVAGVGLHKTTCTDSI